MKPLLIALLVLLLLGLGFVLGWQSAVREASLRSVPVAVPQLADVPAPEAPASAGELDEILADPPSLEALREMAESAADWGTSPKRVVRGLIDQMDDDTLVALVSSLTDFERAELEEVSDMRGFVKRLAEIAMDGTLTPSPPISGDTKPVTFTRRVAADNSPAVPTNHFSDEDTRIYAVFPSDELEADRVMAKWTRVEDGEIVLFGRYAIDEADAWSYVWLGRPASGWKPGEYRVDFFTADERMQMVATGEHVVTR